MQEHVYICTHAAHVEHRKLQSHSSVTSSTVYRMAQSFADGTLQVLSLIARVFSMAPFFLILCVFYLSQSLCGNIFLFTSMLAAQTPCRVIVLKARARVRLSFGFACVLGKLLSMFCEKIPQTY